MGMKSDIERKTARVLDLLSPMQIAAWVAGSLHLGDQMRRHPHPRKTNASARGNTADLYEAVLHRELIDGLTRRHPEKARQVAQELRWAQSQELVTMGAIVEERLDLHS
jgi:hypothetical protein